MFSFHTRSSLKYSHGPPFAAEWREEWSSGREGGAGGKLRVAWAGVKRTPPPPQPPQPPPPQPPPPQPPPHARSHAAASFPSFRILVFVYTHCATGHFPRHLVASKVREIVSGHSRCISLSHNYSPTSRAFRSHRAEGRLVTSMQRLWCRW